MIQKTSLSKLNYGAGCLVLFFLAAAASFNGYYDKWRLLDAVPSGSTQGGHTFEPMVDGTANRPFVYRQLLPMLAGWIDTRVPESAKDQLFQTFVLEHKMELPRHPFDSPVLQDRRYFLRYSIIYALVFLFAWLAVCAMYLVGISAGHTHGTSALASIAMILLLPYFLTVGGFFYDYPELAFFALAVWMALNFNWWWLIPVVALAAWNKESFLLFIPTLYPIMRIRSSRNTAVAGTAVLGSTSLAVYCLLRARFQHNPGGSIEIHLLDQIRYLLHPSNFFSPEWNYGVPGLQGFNPFSMAILACIIWRGWPYLKPPFKRHAQIAAAINIPLFVLLCFPGELRDLSLLYVTLFLLLAANLAELADRQSTHLTRPST